MARPALTAWGAGAASERAQRAGAASERAQRAGKLYFCEAKIYFYGKRFSKKKLAKFFSILFIFAKQKIKNAKNFVGTLKFRVRKRFP